MTTKPFLSICLATTGLLALTTSGDAKPPHKAKAHKAVQAKAASHTSPEWQPSAALLSQLGPEVDLIGFHVRAPKGWTLEQKAFQTAKMTGTT